MNIYMYIFLRLFCWRVNFHATLFRIAARALQKKTYESIINWTANEIPSAKDFHSRNSIWKKTVIATIRKFRWNPWLKRSPRTILGWWIHFHGILKFRWPWDYADFLWNSHWKKYANINDTLRRIIGILVDWHISECMLTRIACYPCQDTLLHLQFYNFSLI